MGRVLVVEVTSAAEPVLQGLEQAGMIVVHASFDPRMNGAPVHHHASGSSVTTDVARRVAPAVVAEPATDVAIAEELAIVDTGIVAPGPPMTPNLPNCNLCFGMGAIPRAANAAEFDPGAQEVCPRCHGAGVADPAVCCGDRCVCH